MITTLLNLVTVRFSRPTRRKPIENSSATVSGSGDASEAKQDAILGKLIEVVSSVSTGGTITTYKGDDNVGVDMRAVPVDDAGEVLKDLLQAEAVSSIVFGAGRGNRADQITGAVASDDITHGGGTTLIPVAILSKNKVSATPANDYTYHIKAVNTSDNEQVKIKGTVDLRAKRASVS